MWRNQLRPFGTSGTRRPNDLFDGQILVHSANIGGAAQRILLSLGLIVKPVNCQKQQALLIAAAQSMARKLRRWGRDRKESRKDLGTIRSVQINQAYRYFWTLRVFSGVHVKIRACPKSLSLCWQ
jgi:hypothetical protein